MIRCEPVCAGWDRRCPDVESQPYRGPLTPEEASRAWEGWGEADYVGERYTISHRWGRWVPVPVRAGGAFACSPLCPTGGHVHYAPADGPAPGAFPVTVLVRAQEGER